MINKINFAQGLHQAQFRPAFRANDDETKTITVPENNVNFRGEQEPVVVANENVTEPKELSFKGAEALANYNKPNVMAFDKSVLEVEPLLPTIIQPDSIGSIEGEKIYGSNGKLNSIVNRVGDKVVVYTASPENDNMIASIVTTDKKTGNVIKRQDNDIEDGKYIGMTVLEYDPVTGEGARETYYENNEPSYASKVITNNRGLRQEIGYEFSNGHYRVSESTPDKKLLRHYEFNKNKELISAWEDKNNGQSSSTVEFYNGAVLSVEHTKQEVLPNNMGREVLNDPDVKPADLSAYPDSIEGEKTFYSNGSLESVTAGNLVYNYSPAGDVTSIKDGNKTVEVNDRVTVITENLEDGAVKTTKYFKNGNTWIDYEKGDYQKQLILNGDLPDYYYEDKGDSNLKTFRYNDKGMLISAWGDDI